MRGAGSRGALAWRHMGAGVSRLRQVRPRNYSIAARPVILCERILHAQRLYKPRQRFRNDCSVLFAGADTAMMSVHVCSIFVFFPYPMRQFKAFLVSSNSKLGRKHRYPDNRLRACLYWAFDVIDLNRWKYLLSTVFLITHPCNIEGGFCFFRHVVFFI